MNSGSSCFASPSAKNLVDKHESLFEINSNLLDLFMEPERSQPSQSAGNDRRVKSQASVVPINLKIQEDHSKFEEHEDFLYKSLQRGQGLVTGSQRPTAQGENQLQAAEKPTLALKENLHLQKPENSKNFGRYGFFGISSSAKKVSSLDQAFAMDPSLLNPIGSSKIACVAMTNSSQIEESKLIQDKSTTGESQGHTYDNFHDLVSKHKRNATIGTRVHLTGSGGRQVAKFRQETTQRG